MRAWLLLFLMLPCVVNAHQFQTLAVSLEEQGNDQLSVVMKSSLGRDDRPANVAPRIEPDCQPTGAVRQERSDKQILRSWTLHCPGGLQGRTLKLLGLGPTSPDAVVMVRYANGQTLTQVLDRREYWLELGTAEGQTGIHNLTAYLPIGIKHILTGPDHLLFVLCLMLVVTSMQLGWGRLLGTVTAFTVAHSLTLAASTLYGYALPVTSVEAVIALSILLLAVELARRQRWPEMPPGLSLRYPAAVAFAFGLLHGFGFAGALSEVGLPEAAAGWALLLFNLGVEAGQLLFVMAMLGLYWLTQRGLKFSAQRHMPTLVTIIGAVSAYWFIDRLWPVFIV